MRNCDFLEEKMKPWEIKEIMREIVYENYPLSAIAEDFGLSVVEMLQEAKKAVDEEIVSYTTVREFLSSERHIPHETPDYYTCILAWRELKNACEARIKLRELQVV